MTDKPRIRLYGSDQCPYCVAARMLLTQKGLPFEDVPVGGDYELRKQMESLSGGWSVPQIFLDGAPIGGFDELHELDKSGELDRMLGISENA